VNQEYLVLPNLKVPGTSFVRIGRVQTVIRRCIAP
jgi:hypothetical protein